jgi:hypothetical protein
MNNSSIHREKAQEKTQPFPFSISPVPALFCNHKAHVCTQQTETFAMSSVTFTLGMPSFLAYMLTCALQVLGSLVGFIWNICKDGNAYGRLQQPQVFLSIVVHV